MLKNGPLAAPATPRAEETRRRILEAALELFRERGFDRTSTRDIARRAGVANGAAYYYFRSKEEIVLAFYLETQREMDALTRRPFAETRDLHARLRCLIDLKLDRLAPYRSLLAVLFRYAADPHSPISPFGTAARSTREQSRRLFQEALEGSDTSIPPDLLSQLPRLIWLYHMGVILFWIHDRSPHQRRTAALVRRTLDLIVRLIQLSRFRLIAPLRKAAVALLLELDEPV
jgi:AcrR family transcriptional regulator